MKKLFKINNYTYLFILICALSGLLKNISIIMFICIFHELGHVILSIIFKYKIISIEIFPFGGLTLTDKLINSNINKDILINLGGILNQIILFIIIYLLKSHITMHTYNLFMYYNFTIMIFNMLPIIPLDGNNILHLILEKYFSYYLSYYLNLIFSIIFFVIFIFINIYFNIDNYFIIILLIYQSIIYLKNYKYLYNRFLLERYLYNLDYKSINNDTKNILNLKKEVFSYFKDNNKYVSEKSMLGRYFKN